MQKKGSCQMRCRPAGQARSVPSGGSIWRSGTLSVAMQLRQWQTAARLLSLLQGILRQAMSTRGRGSASAKPDSNDCFCRCMGLCVLHQVLQSCQLNDVYRCMLRSIAAGQSTGRRVCRNPLSQPIVVKPRSAVCTEGWQSGGASQT